MAELETGSVTPACPVCLGTHTRSFFTLNDVPCQEGIIWTTREDAQVAQRGDIELVYCPTCSHVFNCRFDPSKFVFDSNYDTSLRTSPTYQTFIADLTAKLVKQHDLNERTVLEIACGKADFLKAICVPYKNKGIGFDPTFTADALSDAERELISVTPSFFPEQYAGPPGDLVAFRAVLQYMTDPHAFLKTIRPAVKEPAGAVYAEVPNSTNVFERLSIWNIVYEHGCFFSKQSLTRLFADNGYHVQNVFPCWLEESSLGIEAGLTASDRSVSFDPHEVDKFTKIIDRFVGEHRMRVNYWQNTLDRLNTQGKRVAMWGAGARAQSFCNIFDLTDSTLPFIVDINPARQGKFMSKTLQQIVPPKHLLVDKPDVILITNSGYQEEIKKHIADLGIRCEVLVM